MSAPSAAAEITLRMTPTVAAVIHGVLVEGYRLRRLDADATPEWCLDVLRVIESVSDQLKASGHRG